MAKHKHHDITVRMRRRDGKKVSPLTAKKALWAAHKIAQRGGSIAAHLTEWEVEAVDWRAGRRSYTYTGSDATAALENLGGILETLTMEGLRVGVPE